MGKKIELPIKEYELFEPINNSIDDIIKRLDIILKNADPVKARQFFIGMDYLQTAQLWLLQGFTGFEMRTQEDESASCCEDGTPCEGNKKCKSKGKSKGKNKK